MAAVSPDSFEAAGDDPAESRYSSRFMTVSWSVIAAGMVVFAVLLVGLPDSVTMFRDYVLAPGLQLFAGFLLAYRVVRCRRDRTAWLLILIGLTAWLMSDMYYRVQVAVYAADDGAPPGVSDLGYVLFYPFTYIGIGLLIRGYIATSTRLVWFDGLVVVFTAFAFLSLILPEVMERSDADMAAYSLAYTLGDVFLVSGLLGAIGLMGARTQPVWWCLLVAALFFTVADVAWMLSSTTTYEVGASPDLGWLAGSLLFAAAGCMRNPTTVQVSDRVWSPTTVTAGVASFVLLVGATWWVLPTASVAFAVVAIMIGVWRGGMMLRSATVHREEEKLAYRDHLTDLANRRQLAADLTGDPMPVGTLLVLDLDGFKQINDTLGHGAGDSILRALGPRLTAALPTALIARLGGDEFAVFLPGSTDTLMAVATADRIRALVNQPVTVAGMDLQVDASVGIAVSPTDATTLPALLKASDTAMYHAKRARTGSAVYDATRSHTDDGQRQLALVQQIRTAMTDDQFVWLYQPCVDLHTGSLVGMEALLRWRNTDGTLVAPDAVLTAVHNTALIQSIAEQSLTVALTQSAAWAKLGCPAAVTVNLTATNLMDSHLDATIARLLHQHSVAPTDLTLDIQDGVFLPGNDRALAMLTALTELGVRVAVDDYGSTASSLTQIQTVTVTELKLDRQFVVGVADRPDLQAIVAGNLTIAHGMGVLLSAEGIQTEADLAMLVHLGVDRGQGFHLCPPMTATEATAWLRQHPHRVVDLPPVSPTP